MRKIFTGAAIYRDLAQAEVGVVMLFFVEENGPDFVRRLRQDGYECTSLRESAVGSAVSDDFVDVTRGCPAEHQEVYDAACAARALRCDGKIYLMIPWPEGAIITDEK